MNAQIWKSHVVTQGGVFEIVPGDGVLHAVVVVGANVPAFDIFDGDPSRSPPGRLIATLQAPGNGGALQVEFDVEFSRGLWLDTHYPDIATTLTVLFAPGRP